MKENAMRCEKCQELLNEYRKAQLAPAEELAVKAHLEQCPACAQTLAQAEAMKALLCMRHETPQATPEYFAKLQARVQERLSGEQPQAAPPSSRLGNAPKSGRVLGMYRVLRPARSWAAVAALLLVGVLSAVLFSQNRQDSRPGGSLAKVASARSYARRSLATGIAAYKPGSENPPSSKSMRQEEADQSSAKKEMPTAKLSAPKAAVSQPARPAALPAAAAAPASAGQMQMGQPLSKDSDQWFQKQEMQPSYGVAPAAAPLAEVEARGDRAAATPALPSGQSLGGGVDKAKISQNEKASDQLMEQMPRLQLGDKTSRSLQEVERVSAGRAESITTSSASQLFYDAEDARLRGQYAAAVELYERAAKAAGASSVAAQSQLRIGDIAFEKLHDPVRARSAYQACLEAPLSGFLDEPTRAAIRLRMESLSTGKAGQ